MSELTLFKGNRPAYLATLDDDTDALAGKDIGGMRRISIKGNVFREMIGSKEYRVSDDRAIGVIIVKAAAISRSYYGSAYVEGQNSAPTCWSSDTQAPDTTVPEENRQSAKCMDCPQHVKGSGQGESRACRFQQRIAVVLEGEVDKREVYQVICPSTSVFGDGDKNKLPLQAYGRHMKAHNEKSSGVITEMRFDINSPTPKLTFKAVRHITEDEMEVVNELRNSPEAEEAIKMGGGKSAPKAAPSLFADAKPKVEAKKAAPKAVVAEEVVEEPKKVVSKKTTEEVPKLADLVEGWDD